MKLELARGSEQTQALIRLAWLKGNLGYKLRDHQRKLYAFIQVDEAIRRVINCARRFGKTFAICLYCTEQCIKRPGCIIRYAAPTEKQVRKVVRPNMRTILKDCPDDLRPVWNNQDSAYYFPNGSEWHFAGTEKENVEKLRGQGADIVVLDEAGSMGDMEYVANDVLLPQTIDNEGRMIVISTPPITPGHPYVKMANEAELTGDYLKQTVVDNTWMSDIMKAKYMKASGGAESTAWRREYMCEFVVDALRAVIPEFDLLTECTIVKTSVRPEFFEPLVSCDVGYADPTFVLYGYYDFMQAKLIIEDENYLPRARTDEIAKVVKATEARLWGMRPVYMRKTDVDHRLIADMSSQFGLLFTPTAKDDKEAQVNQLRMWIRDYRVVINPRCKHLIFQLKTTIWDISRKEFDRTDEGHGDGVDALIYMLRNAPVRRNPYPVLPHWITPYTHVMPPGCDVRADENREVLAQYFSIDLKRYN